MNVNKIPVNTRSLWKGVLGIASGGTLQFPFLTSVITQYNFTFMHFVLHEDRQRWRASPMSIYPSLYCLCIMGLKCPNNVIKTCNFHLVGKVFFGPSKEELNI